MPRKSQAKLAMGGAWDTIKVAIGGRMRLVREASGMTQREMSSIVNLSQDALSRTETGKREPDLFLIREYAIRCSVTADFLLFAQLSTREIPRHVQDVFLSAWPGLQALQERRDSSHPDTATEYGTSRDAKLRTSRQSARRGRPSS